MWLFMIRPRSSRRSPYQRALLDHRVEEEVLALGGADLRPRLLLGVGRAFGHREEGVGGLGPLRQAALAEHDVEGVDVVEVGALAEQDAGRRRRACLWLSRRAASGRSPKSSQAARNSCLSAARSSASRRRQAGSILKNVNLANVRSAIGDDSGRRDCRSSAGPWAGFRLTFSGADAGGRPRFRQRKSTRRFAPPRTPPSSQRGRSKVTLVWLPPGSAFEELASARACLRGCSAPGSARCRRSRPTSTSAQGNRVFDSLYDAELPGLDRELPSCVVQLRSRRADSAPAEIVPGLLASTLKAAGSSGVPAGGRSVSYFCRATASAGHPATCEKVKRNPRPRTPSRMPVDVRDGRPGRPVVPAAESARRRPADRDRGPPPPETEALAIGIAGRGFDGNLTSDSTRTRRLRPLHRRRADDPRLVRDRGAVGDVGRADPRRGGGRLRRRWIALGERMAVISDRRGSGDRLSLLVWIVVSALVAAASRGALRPAGSRSDGDRAGGGLRAAGAARRGGDRAGGDGGNAAGDARRAAAGGGDAGARSAATGRWRWPRR